MTTRVVKTERQRAEAMMELKWAELPLRLTMTEGDKRSLDQNALLHKWLGEIAKARGDVTAARVKAESHVKHGFPILQRERAWGGFYKAALAHLTYEQQLYALEQGWVPVTRIMTVEQLREYMDALQMEAAQNGWKITIPEDA